MARFKFTHNEVIRFTVSAGHDVALTKGKIYNLPENNSYISALVGQGYLEKVVEKKTSTRNSKKSSNS